MNLALLLFTVLIFLFIIFLEGLFYLGLRPVRTSKNIYILNFTIFITANLCSIAKRDDDISVGIFVCTVFYFIIIMIALLLSHIDDTTLYLNFKKPFDYITWFVEYCEKNSISTEDYKIKQIKKQKVQVTLQNISFNTKKKLIKDLNSAGKIDIRMINFYHWLFLIFIIILVITFCFWNIKS